MRIGKELRELILFSLAGKRGDEAKNIIDDLHKQVGLSVGYIYKISDVVRANGRAIRKDAGLARLRITPEQYDAVHAFTANYDIKADRAIELAELNGMIEPGVLKPWRYNEWLRAVGHERLRYKTDVRPSRTIERFAPNIMHQFDTTKLEELHYDRETEILSWDPRANRKNSRGEKPDPIWLYSLVDDFSRVKFAYLYRSENQYNHLDFFLRAWSQKDKTSEFPFYGIPSQLYMDKGPVNYSTKVLNALHRLNIFLVPTTPSTSEPFGSRKHGKVENVFKTYGEWLKEFQIHPLLWDEAQEFLYQLLLKLNGSKIHSITHARPFERWLSIKMPRHMPDADLYHLLKFDRATRVVDKYLTISIDSHLYKLPEKRPYVDWVNRKIEVYWEPGHYEKIFAVYRTTEIELRECAADVIHIHNAEQTSIDQARAQAATADHSNLKLYATDRRGPAYLPKRGEEFDDKRIAEKWVEAGSEPGTLNLEPGTAKRPSFAPERYLGYVAAARELQEQGFLAKPLSPAEQAWLKGLFGNREQISETELMEAVKQAKAAAEKMEAEG